MLWRQCRADPPSRHRVSFACAIDDDGALQQLVRQIEKRWSRAGTVIDPPIDFVGYDPDLVLPSPFGDRLELRKRIHRPGRIAGRAEDQAAGELVAHAIQIFYADLEAPFGIARNQYRLGPSEMNDLGIGHPGRRGDQNPLFGTEQSETR